MNTKHSLTERARMDRVIDIGLGLFQIFLAIVIIVGSLSVAETL